MSKPKAPKETAEQKAERRRAEASKLNAIQGSVSDRTAQFQRLTNPRASIFSGSVQRRAALL